MLRVFLLAFALCLVAGAEPDEPDERIDIRRGVGPLTFDLEEKQIQQLGPQPYAEHYYFFGGKAWGATWVWPQDPLRRIIAVLADPPDDRPAFIVIQGYGSKYVLPNGIRLGSSLDHVQKLNGKPFSLKGIAQDECGMVLDWNNGKLAAQLPNVKLFFRNLEGVPESLSETEVNAVTRPQLRSDAPIWKKAPLEIWKIQIARPK